ncbi:hypothetical protein [Gillisia marina]|uniref:hypothetical protein n=1 Tax=Gillisia marina TaxID=1167637 RepID=UPI000494D49A|nr:hypothetical protein [Gillisia marina]
MGILTAKRQPCRTFYSFRKDRAPKKYKYQLIAYYEYMALLSYNFIKIERLGKKKENPYQGPWDPYVRDIDPTILISETGVMMMSRNKNSGELITKFLTGILQTKTG